MCLESLTKSLRCFRLDGSAMVKRKSRKRRRKQNVEVEERKLPPQPMTHKQMKEHAQQSEEASITVQPTKEERLHQDLTCSICTSIAWEPVQTECDHIFCKQCLNDWMRATNSEDGEQAKCPLDRKLIDKTKVHPLKEINPLGWKMIGRIEVKCPRYESLGCDWIGEYSDAYDHVQHKCAYSLDQCQWCHSSFQRRHLDQHENDDCSERPIVCSYCEESIPFEDMDDHIQLDCSKVSVQCMGDKKGKVVLDGAVTPCVVINSPSTGCGAVMVRSSYQLHLRDECPATLIPCSYARHGCNVGLIKRGSMSNHLTSNMSQHLELVTATLAKTNNKLDGVVNKLHNDDQPPTSQSKLMQEIFKEIESFSAQIKNTQEQAQQEQAVLRAELEKVKTLAQTTPSSSSSLASTLTLTSGSPRPSTSASCDSTPTQRPPFEYAAPPTAAIPLTQRRDPITMSMKRNHEATDYKGSFIEDNQPSPPIRRHHNYLAQQRAREKRHREAQREQRHAAPTQARTIRHAQPVVAINLESLTQQILERQNLSERQRFFHQLAREADQQMEKSNITDILESVDWMEQHQDLAKQQGCYNLMAQTLDRQMNRSMIKDILSRGLCYDSY